MKDVEAGNTCKYCGAPATTEICPFCHNPTGIKPLQADLDYPMINSKPAHLDKKRLGEYILGIVVYSIFILPALVLSYRSGMRVFTSVFFACSIFIVFVIIEYVIPLCKMISRYILVKNHGKKITATVYGYMDYIGFKGKMQDIENNSNTQITYNHLAQKTVKLLANSKQGKRFILYPLGINKTPFEINQEVQLMYYKDCFILLDLQKYLR